MFDTAARLLACCIVGTLPWSSGFAGKKVITTTTAAFDCQSKPNHITIIGAMPTIGSAEMKLPTGSSPR